jgi:hypothetical protein
MDFEGCSNITKRQSRAVELFGNIHLSVVERWVASTSRGTVQVIRHGGTVNTELFGPDVHGSTAFVPLKQSLRLVRR